MGIAILFTCPECENSLFLSEGVGFRYPRICEETRKQAINGEYGNDLKELLSSFSDCVIDAAQIVLKCPDCHTVTNQKDLSVYELNDDSKKEQYQKPSASKSDPRSYPFSDVDTLIYQYPHLCPKCGKLMQKISLSMYMDIHCPKCGSIMEASEFEHWD